MQDILYDVPGITAPNSSVAPSLGGSDSQGGGIIIRGVASNPGGGGAGTPLSGSSTTAVYTDGVYEGIGGDYDLQRLEVLRGPQGTLYGRSATSGVVAIYTTDPMFETVTGDASAQLGNYGQRRFTGALNVPLSDNFAIRAAIARDGADRGYRNEKGDAFDR
ncbi:Outer membrane salicin receptor, partial [Novosphingobium sp. Rr 2-17]